ncbi:MAG: DUF3659 domain-containing protein [Selenomonadaceae bacterium]|nr:DUF3659 domain-containing protein [Selenomonadaceae bacterium]
MAVFKILHDIFENLTKDPKHYLYLLIWGVGMYLAATTKFEFMTVDIHPLWIFHVQLDLNFLLVFVYLFFFFLVTTYKYLGKMLTTCVIVGILCGIFPPLALVLTVASMLFILLKIKFLFQNWRALLIGGYAYVGGLLITLNLRGSSSEEIFIVALIATLIFNKLVQNLYQRGYETDRAFSIIGITPFTVLTFILPFLKVDVDGQEVFHGIFSDHASIDIHGHIADVDVDLDALPDDVVHIMDETGITDTIKATNITAADLIKLTGFNINDIVNIPELSQAIGASVAVSAAYGVFKLSDSEQECTIRNEDGSVDIVSPIDDTHSIIKDQNGNKIGAIYFDKQNNRETVILSNGFTYSIEKATGNVVDGKGKILGKITEDAQGNKILSDENGAVVRKFDSDGKIFDSNNNELGYVAV